MRQISTSRRGFHLLGQDGTRGRSSRDATDHIAKRRQRRQNGSSGCLPGMYYSTIDVHWVVGMLEGVQMTNRECVR